MLNQFRVCRVYSGYANGADSFVELKQTTMTARNTPVDLDIIAGSFIAILALALLVAATNHPN